MHFPALAVSEWIGVYGAALSTGILVSQIISSRPKVKVEVCLKGVANPRIFNNPIISCVVIEARNYGKVSVTIGGVGFEFKKDEELLGYVPTESAPGVPMMLPQELLPGQCLRISVPIDTVKAELEKHGLQGSVKLHGWYMDQLKREYHAKPFVFSPKN